MNNASDDPTLRKEGIDTEDVRDATDNQASPTAIPDTAGDVPVETSTETPPVASAAPDCSAPPDDAAETTQDAAFGMDYSKSGWSYGDQAGDIAQALPVAGDSPKADAGDGASAETKTPAAKKKHPGQGFFSTHPTLSVTDSFTPSVFSRLFNLLSWFPIVVLTAMLAAQVIFSLDARALWYSDEIRHADAFRNFLANGNWFVLEMNGVMYPDKPPLYFWFLRGLYEVVKIEGPFLYFLGAAVSGALYLWSFLLLGRLAARFDGRSILAGGIMLLCGFYVMGVMHYARMDLLFSALIVCSYTAFYHAWIRRNSVPAMLFGFLFAASAVLTKGPLGVILPLAAGVLFLIWRGTPLRLLRWDTLLGLIVAVIVVGAWAGGASLHLGGHEAFLQAYIKEQTLGRVFNAFHHRADWWYYLIGMPLMFLPWTLLFFALPWHGLFGKKMREGLAASRKPESEGYAYLWCIVLSALIVLSLVSGKIVIYFLPALPALALLAGRAVLQLSARRAALFRHTTAVFLLLTGLAFAAASLILFDLLPVPPIKGIPAWRTDFNPIFLLVAAGIILTPFLLWLFLRSSKPEGVLLVVALAFTGLSFPLTTMIAPTFDQFLSPKAQAEVMKGLIKEGYAPVSYRDYGGTYSYYAEHVITEISGDPKQIIGMALHDKIALALRLSDWEKLRDNLPGCVEKHQQWIETRKHILLACDPAAAKQEPPAEQEPAQEPEQTTAQETAPEQTPVQEQEQTPAPERSPEQVPERMPE